MGRWCSLVSKSKMVPSVIICGKSGLVETAMTKLVFHFKFQKELLFFNKYKTIRIKYILSH